MIERNLVIVIVENSSKQMLVHQRKKDRKMFPSRYGLGAGGKINTGETPEQAGKRELKEELGIESEVEKLFEIEFMSKNYHDIVHFYRTTYEGGINPCEREFESGSARWMDKNQTDFLSEKQLLCPDTNIGYIFYKIKYKR